LSKISQYLQGHIHGDVSTRLDVREAVSKDAGVLMAKPDVVIYPRVTNDVRKVARFAMQLAEKKHVLGVVVRGNGSDITGGGIGKGVTLVFNRHMNKIFEYDSKQKLIRLEPGTNIRTVQAALGLHGASIPALDENDPGTVGGAVATDAAGALSATSGTMRQWVDRLEVVLDSGDVLQTGKISRKQLETIKGQPGRIGDIYRGIDTILEENAELIDLMRKENFPDTSGYPGIADVVGKGGSFDLTPLFIGSQGTLGIVVEMILRADFAPKNPAVISAVFASLQDARDAADELSRLKPTVLVYYDGTYIKTALDSGKQYAWIDEKIGDYGASLEIEFHGFSNHKRLSALKKASKILQKYACSFATSQDITHLDELRIARHSVALVGLPPDHNDRSAPLLSGGFYVNPQRFEEFSKELLTLGESLHVEVPIYGSVLRSVYQIRPTVSLQKTADKQKLLKLLDQLTALVSKYDGTIVSSGAEGRLLSRFARAGWSEEYETMMDGIKDVFDPHGILNPGVKQRVELRELIAMLRSDNTLNDVVY